MRKIIVLSFITLDGIMQAPGGPEEDTSGGFEYGGWTAPYFSDADKDAGEIMTKQMQPADLLLGRKTYDIFSEYWPKHTDMWPSIQEVDKFIVSNTLTENTSDWQNVTFISSVDEIRKLKESEGKDLQVHGSGYLIQTLLKHDLVDELWLKTFPITLGSGKRLFGEGTIPAAFMLTESKVTANGVIFANYTRGGSIETGTVGE
jgi:dihydrofolate reductase